VASQPAEAAHKTSENSEEAKKSADGRMGAGVFTILRSPPALNSARRWNSVADRVPEDGPHDEASLFAKIGPSFGAHGHVALGVGFDVGREVRVRSRYYSVVDQPPVGAWLLGGLLGAVEGQPYSGLGAFTSDGHTILLC
jgi:hypothetical protein